MKPFALNLLTQCILDLTIICILTLKTTAAMWAEIVCEYTEKGTMTQTDLCTRFLESKCSEKSDIHAFLDSLHIKREELAQARVQIDEKDYHSTIINSLPYHLSNFTLSQLTTTCLCSLTKTTCSSVFSLRSMTGISVDARLAVKFVPLMGRAGITTRQWPSPHLNLFTEEIKSPS